MNIAPVSPASVLFILQAFFGDMENVSYAYKNVKKKISYQEMPRKGITNMFKGSKKNAIILFLRQRSELND